MSNISLKMSERQQVLLVIPVVLALLAVIWFFVLKPRLDMRSEIEDLKRSNAESEYAGLSKETLRKTLEHERELGQMARDEWAATIWRLSTFEERPEKDVARIDYKLELFMARMRLARRSEELGVQLLPKDLGLREALGANDSDVRVRMVQLLTVEKLVDAILNRQVYKLHSIEPKKPIHHKDLSKKKNLVTEYPVQVDFEVAFEDLYLFFQSVFEENRLFAVRNIRISAGTVPGAPLRVNAVMSSLLFE